MNVPTDGGQMYEPSMHASMHDAPTKDSQTGVLPTYHVPTDGAPMNDAPTDEIPAEDPGKNYFPNHNALLAETQTHHDPLKTLIDGDPMNAWKDVVAEDAAE